MIAKWPPSPYSFSNTIFKIKVSLPPAPSTLPDSVSVKNKKEEILDEENADNYNVPDFTGTLSEITLPEVKVKANLKNLTTRIELPKKYFRAKNLQI